jgi:hypothetical protein
MYPIEVVKRDPFMLQYVKEQTPEVCRVAVQQNRDAAKYVKIAYPG